MQQFIRFNPTQPNYSDAMPDIRERLPWQTPSEAVETAISTDRPLFAVIAAPWSTGAHLISKELSSPSLQKLIINHFVPVHIDPTSDPKTTGKIVAFSRHQTGDGALPILSILTHELNPAFAMHYNAPEHRSADTPSIEGLLTAISNEWANRDRAFEAEWNQTRNVLKPSDIDVKKDEDIGGFDEPSRQLRPFQIAMSAMDHSNDEWIDRTIETLWKRGIRDQLEASFFAGSRDSKWAIPYFEKVMAQNAAIAYVFARVAKRRDDRELRSRAQDIVRYCLNAFLQETDIISAESHYYTWLSTEVYDAVSRANLQSLALRYNIQPSRNRLILGQVRSIDEITETSFDSKDQVNARLLEGQAEMLMHRRTRPSPRPITMDNPAWRSESYRWLAYAMDALESDDARLLHNKFITWVTDQKHYLESTDVRDAQNFQGLVSLFGALKLAEQATANFILPPLVSQVQQHVIEGVTHWNRQDSIERLWLHQHGYLPSVAFCLEMITKGLPESDQLQLN